VAEHCIEAPTLSEVWGQVTATDAGMYELQTPALQIAFFGHLLPQVPQFWLSVWRSTQAAPQQLCPVGQAQHFP
jgi:hypothetical protein